MEQHTIFAQRLRQSMQQLHLKQIDIVRQAQEQGIKLSRSQMSQYMSGYSIPRQESADFLAKQLNVELNWLLGLDNHTVRHHTNQSDAKQIHSTIQSQHGESTTMSNTIHAQSALEYGNDALRPQAQRFTGNTYEGEGSHRTARTFSKSHKLDHVLYDVRGPVVDEALRMEAEGTDVLKLNIGNPAPFGFRTPDEVVYDMRRQLTECEGYSPTQGLFSARKAIMQYSQIRGLPNVSMDHIYTGNGVSELINLSMSALLDSGDEVLVPSPDYPLWTACVTLAGGTPVHYVCDEQSEWYPDLDDMRSKITDRTKAIVIINPNNPTGAVYPREILEQIVEVAREHELMIFSDEIYDRLVMDGLQHTSIASLAPDLFCVTFSGLSKSHMIAGYRIGWMVLSGNKRIATDYIEGLNMLSNMRLCSNVPAQSIVQTALGGHQSVNDYIVPGGRIFEQRKTIMEALDQIDGISYVKPKAAFYIFPKLDVNKFNIHNDEQFALDLLREQKLLVVHGGGFNWSKPDHFRIVFLPRRGVLTEACERLDTFLQHYRQ